MVTIQVDEHTAELISTLAKERGVSTAEYLRNLLVSPDSKTAKLPADQFIDQVEQLSVDGPSLPADFSRADIYGEHN